jgi:hypothetical protein
MDNAPNIGTSPRDDRERPRLLVQEGVEVVHRQQVGRVVVARGAIADEESAIMGDEVVRTSTSRHL